MKLQHIKLEDLKISPLNVRTHGETDGHDLAPDGLSSGSVVLLMVTRLSRGEE